MRIRTGGVEVEVASALELESLRARGLVGPDAEVYVGNAWQPLDGPPAPRAAPAVADPWSAWQQADASTAEEALAAYARRDVAPAEVPELPLAAVAPMPKPVIVNPHAVAELPDDAVAPVPGAPKLVIGGNAAPPRAAPPPEPPPATPPAKPATAPPPPPPAPRPLPPARGDEGDSLPPPWLSPAEAPARPAARPAGRPREAPSGTTTVTIRPTHVLGIVATLLLVIGGLWAMYQLSRPMTAPVISVGEPAPPPEAAPTDVAAVMAAVEAELRSVPLGDPHPVSRAGDLGDAILIELQKLRVDVVRVDAPVTKWGGKKLDDPAVAEVRVHFRSRGKLDRELGAVALVVGRYKQRYTIDIPVLEARWESEGGTRAKLIDARTAELFTQGRAKLGQVLGLP